MPNAPLNINYARLEDIQNSSDLLTVISSGLVQRDDLSITPSVLSRYFLYNRSLGNFGINDETYINYPGGFITVGSKIDTKYSDFSIQNSLTVTLSSLFNKGFDMRNVGEVNTNRILNIKSVNNVGDLTSRHFDDEAISVGAFKRLWYTRGMVMMWSGTYEDLRRHLPFWRLCAPPDSGTIVNGVNIPNLQGKFIMGGSYGEYTSNDNFNPPRSFSTPTTIGSEGGENVVTLNINNLPPHNHSYDIITGDGFSTITTTEGTPPTFYTGLGGEIRGLELFFFSIRRTLVMPSVSHSGGNARLRVNTVETRNVVQSPTRSPLTTTTIGFTPDPIVITRVSVGEENVGNDESHENRPPFYALAYIIYVGIPR